MQNETLGKIQQYLGNSYYLDNSVKSDPLIIYPIDKSIVSDYSAPKNFIRLDVVSKGWYTCENWNGIPTRWIANNAKMSYFSEKNTIVNLEFSALSFNQTRTLMVYLNDNEVIQAPVPVSGKTLSLRLPVEEGGNRIRIYIPEGCEIPSDNPNLGIHDNRCISIALRNVTISQDVE